MQSFLVADSASKERPAAGLGWARGAEEPLFSSPGLLPRGRF